MTKDPKTTLLDKIITQLRNPLKLWQSSSNLFGTTLTNHNCIREEVKNEVSSRNACYCVIHNLKSFGLLYKFWLESLKRREHSKDLDADGWYYSRS